MALEIEKKFLVDADKLIGVKSAGGEKIVQGYLSLEPNKIVRVRTKKNRGFLTIKSATVGIVRQEFEYEIPFEDAEKLLKLCEPNVLCKTRYKIEYAGKIWEIDFFEGRHAGLILAEVELKNPDEFVELPEWICEEVSDNPKYFNSNLVADI